MLTIMAAMEQELRAVRRALRHLPSGGEPCSLRLLGVGRESGRAGFEDWLATRRSQMRDPGRDAVLFLGFAGAVDPELRPGDLVMPNRYCRGSIQGRPSAIDTLRVDPGLAEQAVEAAVQHGLRIIRSDSFTVDWVVATPGEKSAIGSRYLVGIVDMEDYWLAEAAANAGIPFLAVRAVVDTAEQALPQDVLELAGHPVKAAAGVLARPGRLPGLLRLRSQMRLAQWSLSRFVVAMLVPQPLNARREAMTVG